MVTGKNVNGVMIENTIHHSRFTIYERKRGAPRRSSVHHHQFS
jgi:hypothetical protein